MRIIKTPSEMMLWRLNVPAGDSVGFVPTMGALHEGHQSLLFESKKANKWSVLSIFVNPTQFNDKNDFEKYPNTFDKDRLLAETSGVDVLFYPTFNDLYPDNYRFKLSENDFSLKFCGAHRPGHFDGVLTIVLKLLNIVNANSAYFGEKDFQQLSLIRNMSEAFFLPTRIVNMPTIREKDGLAMSSRNARLTPEERERAPLFYKTISETESVDEAKKTLTNLGFKVDYIEDFKNRRFAAAFLGEIRLIDNVQI